MLPPGSAEPGPFESRRTPYVIPIQDQVWRSEYKTVVAVMGSQMGKTDGVLVCPMGHKLHDDPAPLLYIGPTRSFVEGTFEPRFRAMIVECAELWRRLAKGKREKKTLKTFAGIKVRLAWAGSATELAGEVAAKVMLDELDRMDRDVEGEGDPKTLADNRHATFADGQTVAVSSPTTGNVETEIDPVSGLERWAVSENVESPIWKLWQEGTRHEFAWPCPHCGDYFIPRFKLLWWPRNEEGESCDPFEALEEARMVCPHCGSMIEDRHKDEMNARGQFVAPGQRIEKDGTVVGDPPRSETVSFWTSGLCSPWKTFGQRAYSWLSAIRAGVPEEIQAVINTGFGELYSVRGEAPPVSSVENLRQPYKFGDHILGVQRLTLGVDVQKDRLVYAVRGWGTDMESWLLEAGELFGDTAQIENPVWLDLAKFRDRFFCGLSIERVFIDSGYRTSVVYAFCRKFLGWAIPTKGRETMDAPLKKTFIDTTPAGNKRLKSGLAVWTINTDYFKRWVHERLDRDPELPGGWHLSEDTTDDYCRQLVAEARVVKASGRVVWVMLRKDNHFLDCEALNVACAYSLQLQMLTEHKAPPPPPPSSAAPPADDTGRGVDPFSEGDYSGWFDDDK